MSLSPTKHRQITRQRSSPSIAVGLPPELPSSIMQPSTSSLSLHKRTQSHSRIHTGDVSSATSSPGATDNEDEWFSKDQTTPKRKVVGLMDPIPAVRSSRLRTDRSRLKTSKSTGDHLGTTHSSLDLLAAASSHSTHLAPSSPRKMPRSEVNKSQITHISNSSDKVIVCVR
jgi:hypothetical protein